MFAGTNNAQTHTFTLDSQNRIIVKNYQGTKSNAQDVNPTATNSTPVERVCCCICFEQKMIRFLMLQIRWWKEITQFIVDDVKEIGH